MIRRLGYRDLALTTIRWADVNEKADRLGRDNVRELAVTYDLTDGPLNAPIVRQSDKKLFAGHDRVAAAELMRRGTVTVHLVEGTDEELAEVAVIENLFRRRDDQDALKRQLVDLRAKRITGQSDPKLPTVPKRGRPPSPAGIARQQIAQERGTTVEALKAAEKRDRAKEQAAAQNGADAPGVPHGAPNSTAVIPPAPAPPVRTFGAPLPDEVLALVVARQEHVDKAARLITQAVAELTRLKASEGEGEHAFGRLHEEVSSVGRKLRLERPSWVCPWCKGQLDVPCMSCGGIRYWTEAQAKSTDIDQRYLLEGEDAHVCVRGNPVPLTRWRASQAPENRGADNGR